MKTPLSSSVKMEAFALVKNKYTLYICKRKLEHIFLTWDKYKKAAQAERQASTYKPGF